MDLEKLNLEKLKRIQEELAKNVVLQDYIKPEEVKFVIGVDQSFIGEKKIVSACVVLTFPDLREFSNNVRVEDVKFPYIPTFLMFREGDPAVNVIKDALKEVDKENTIVLVDGSGIAHPRRCGLATYVALKLKIPTIGVTKRKLFGEVTYPKSVMEATPIYDKNEVIGYALKPCKMCNPIFISPGSYITPKTALEIVKMCMKGHKLPEPIRLAHELATKSKSQSLSFFLDI